MQELIKQVQEACAAAADAKSLEFEKEYGYEEHADSADQCAVAIRALDLSHLSGWQPIDSAPKDGTEILIYCIGRRPYITGVKWRNGCFVQLSDYSPVEWLTAKGWMPTPPAE